PEPEAEYHVVDRRLHQRLQYVPEQAQIMVRIFTFDVVQGKLPYQIQISILFIQSLDYMVHSIPSMNIFMIIHHYITASPPIGQRADGSRVFRFSPQFLASCYPGREAASS